MKKIYSYTAIECQDKIHEKIAKLTALIHVANAEDFLEFDAQTLKNYLWLLRDLVLDCAHHLETMERLFSFSDPMDSLLPI
jgi:hypothetical protein